MNDNHINAEIDEEDTILKISANRDYKFFLLLESFSRIINQFFHHHHHPSFILSSSSSRNVAKIHQQLIQGV